MEEYKFLLDIAIILAMTKSFSLVSKKFNMPPVVGALIAGIILGPVVLNVVSPSDSVLNLAEVGVVVLMFQAGLETDIDELKKSGIPAFVIALCGVLIPLIMGAVLSVIYGNNIMESIFIGVILTATSVSITVEALQDMGHLKGRVGTAILGAAIIDDILGIVLLSIMTSLGGASGFHIQAILKILIQMAAFFAISIIGGVGIKKFFEWLSTYKNPEIERHRRRVPVFALAFCLALAFLAEVFGIADITGALIIFTIILCVIAVISKIAGCVFGALLCKYTKRESVQIGAGMVCRGEVALIVAQKGISVGLLSEIFFAPVVIMVLVTTLLSPIILKMLFAK